MTRQRPSGERVEKDILPNGGAFLGPGESPLKDSAAEAMIPEFFESIAFRFLTLRSDPVLTFDWI